uniref:Uncharacterized protein n=1 Tax=Anguilla anguilla TaxID=7936 RepID=A0A0E9WLR4_ANGAN
MNHIFNCLILAKCIQMAEQYNGVFFKIITKSSVKLHNGVLCLFCEPLL